MESPRKRSRMDPYPTPPLPSDQSRLEAFMDKLSMWQLMSGLEQISTKSKSISNSKEDERDWMQVFFGEIVESQWASSIQWYWGSNIDVSTDSNANFLKFVLSYAPKFSPIRLSPLLGLLLPLLVPLHRMFLCLSSAVNHQHANPLLLFQPFPLVPALRFVRWSVLALARFLFPSHRSAKERENVVSLELRRSGC